MLNNLLSLSLTLSYEVIFVLFVQNFKDRCQLVNLSTCLLVNLFLFDDAKLRHKKRCMKQRHAPLREFLTLLTLILRFLFT